MERRACKTGLRKAVLTVAIDRALGSGRVRGDGDALAAVVEQPSRGRVIEVLVRVDRGRMARKEHHRPDLLCWVDDGSLGRRLIFLR